RVVITVASPTKSSSPISSLLAIFLGLPGPLCLFPNVFSLSAVLLVAAPLCCSYIISINNVFINMRNDKINFEFLFFVFINMRNDKIKISLLYSLLVCLEIARNNVYNFSLEPSYQFNENYYRKVSI
ncbi:hypothetical protein BpHYR1_038289, partial [Brachionus plicatilis]